MTAWPPAGLWGGPATFKWGRGAAAAGARPAAARRPSHLPAKPASCRSLQMQGMELLHLTGAPAPVLPPGPSSLLPPGAPGPLPLLPPAAAAPGMVKPTLLQVCRAGKCGCCVSCWRAVAGAPQQACTCRAHGRFYPLSPRLCPPSRPIPAPALQNALKTSSLSRMEELQSYLHRCDDPSYLQNYLKASWVHWSVGQFFEPANRPKMHPDSPASPDAGFASRQL